MTRLHCSKSLVLARGQEPLQACRQAARQRGPAPGAAGILLAGSLGGFPAGPSRGGSSRPDPHDPGPPRIPKQGNC